MSRPPRRCRTCNEVTARYLRTERHGAMTVKVWRTDAVRGEVLAGNGAFVWCRTHAPAEPAAFVAAQRRPVDA